ncbi:hypothetical protein [Nocardioides sp. SYSU DS0651]
MTDTQMTPRLEMRWVPTTDNDGRTRIVARWVEVEVGRPASVHSAAAA